MFRTIPPILRSHLSTSVITLLVTFSKPDCMIHEKRPQQETVAASPTRTRPLLYDVNVPEQTPFMVYIWLGAGVHEQIEAAVNSGAVTQRNPGEYVSEWHPDTLPAAATSQTTTVSQRDLDVCANSVRSYPWKERIVTTVFWIGEERRGISPCNAQSSWDTAWMERFGGADLPGNRKDFLPAGFRPGLNPFYCALPYNDVENRRTKPEASHIIPWFNAMFEKSGKSVCKDRWVEIRDSLTGRVCYAQWSDCGPFRTDHWQYVFGDERPKPNMNHGAGLDVSPAVQEYLGIGGMGVCDWKFVDVDEVRDGPWARIGENNTVLQKYRPRVKLALR